MRKTVLITGGAGFIGSHVADELLAHGYAVRILDNLCEQVHGPHARRPSYLDDRAELIVGDVCDREAVRQALDGVQAVIHLAAAVGVGQSMYAVANYTQVNNIGTAVLLEELTKHDVERLVVASSMSVYGEGRYRANDGTNHDDVERSVEQLRAGRWEPSVAGGSPLVPVATPEEKAPKLSSIYALSKFDQEKMCLMLGRAYGVPVVALRLFNTYGPRQALSNPYTGVLAIFAAQLLNGNPPSLFEDGQQRRDFVSVYDVARAMRLALVSVRAVGHAINVGSGRSVTVAEAALRVARAIGRTGIRPSVTRQHRVGDIRHCFADISRARELLEFEPQESLEHGLAKLVPWLADARAVDRSETARRELESRGLTL